MTPDEAFYETTPPEAFEPEEPVLQDEEQKIEELYEDAFERQYDQMTEYDWWLIS